MVGLEDGALGRRVYDYSVQRFCMAFGTELVLRVSLRLGLGFWRFWDAWALIGIPPVLVGWTRRRGLLLVYVRSSGQCRCSDQSGSETW